MKDYDKNYFWTTVDPETNIKKYFFKINGLMVEVPKDVYNTCFSSYVKSLRDNKRDSNVQLISMDAINHNEHSLENVIASNVDVAEEVYHQILIEQIHHEINQLSDEEKQIIFGLLYEDKSIRKLADELHMPVMTLQSKKQRIFLKLRKKLEK